MRKSAKIIRSLSLALSSAAVLFVIGSVEKASAQERDPFAKRVVVVPKSKSGVPGKPGTPKPPKPVPTVVGAPPIQQRIDNYKMLRARAIELGVAAPKPTVALTVSEIEVTGIFRTPRGYSAMVEATPIKLSYTIYPGEKFFDGYLVAIEDNRLVFNRETRMSNGKVLTAAENKGLKVPTLNDMLVPRVETANNQPAPTTNPTVTVPAVAVQSNSAQSETVLTADNKSAEQAADKSSTTSVESAAPSNSTTPKNVRRVNPRGKSK